MSPTPTLSASPTRRSFLKGLAAAPLVLAAPPLLRAADPLVRYDLASPKGLEMLAVYANAVRAMQAMGPDNPMSWMWQWYTHFVDGTTTKSAELQRIFAGAGSPENKLAIETWNTCQSHAGQNSNHFLPWHRMFVFYFERIVRQVSGRPDFTLPYWDYTSADPAKRGIVPEPFRLPNDPVFDSLYRPDRSPLANSGQPIHMNQPRDVMDISDAMGRTHYSTVDGVTGFCRAIDSGIHGRIHVLVGTSNNMGSVPNAGRDPLFWVHHANIDRMWASWNRNGGKNPTASWGDNVFVFADGNGARVARPLKNFFSVLSLGYGYDAYLPKPVVTASGTAGPRTKAAPAGATQRIAQARAEANLGAQAVRVSLQPVADAPRTAVLGFDPAQPERRTWLVLRDLHAWAQPEVLFHVYLTPAQGGPSAGRANYVGDINFFDAEFHDHGNGALGDALGENQYSFDVTGILRGFASSGVTGARDALAVTIVPAGRPAGGRPMVGRIELVRQ